MLRPKADTELVLTSLVVHYGAYRATDKNQAERCSPPLAAALLSLIICALQTRLSVTVLLRLLEKGTKWPRARNKRLGIHSDRENKRRGRERKSEWRKLARVIPVQREFFFRRSVPTARRGWV